MKMCQDLKAQLDVREISLADIEKKFVLDKFTGKQQNVMPKSGWNNLKKSVTDTKYLIKIKRYRV